MQKCLHKLYASKIFNLFRKHQELNKNKIEEKVENICKEDENFKAISSRKLGKNWILKMSLIFSK